MRVLFPARLDAAAKFGGDSQIVAAYARELRSLGCDVTVSHRLYDDYAAFDVVHFVNINNAFETYLRLRRLRAAVRQPAAVLTPLHHKTAWMLPYYRDALGLPLGAATDHGGARFDVVMTAKDMARYGVAALRAPALLPRLARFGTSTFRQKRYIVDHVDALLVHSDEEATSVRADFRAPQASAHVVPVGRDEPRHGTVPAGTPAEYLLSVGRIEPLKNQLALIEATRALDVPLVLVGRTNGRHRGYARRLAAALDRSPHVRYFPFLERPALDALYGGARLHVIASWYEVFPLTTIEAAAAGSRVATTRNSYERGVYGDGIPYLDPSGPAAIRAGLEEASSTPALGAPALVTARVPGWRGAAERLLAAYCRARPGARD